jgi:hypothetical protein
MVSLSNHVHKSIGYSTLRQAQGDKRFFTIGHYISRSRRAHRKKDGKIVQDAAGQYEQMPDGMVIG